MAVRGLGRPMREIYSEGAVVQVTVILAPNSLSALWPFTLAQHADEDLVSSSRKSSRGRNAAAALGPRFEFQRRSRKGGYPLRAKKMHAKAYGTKKAKPGGTVPKASISFKMEHEVGG